MRKIFIAGASICLFTACGGGGGGGFKDPNTVAFTFPAAGTPSSDQANSATAGVGALGETASIQILGSDDSDLSYDVASLPNAMASAAFSGTPTLPMAVAQGEAEVRRRASALLAGNVGTAASGWDDDSCWMVTAAEVVFSRCKLTETDTSGTLVVTVNGALHRATGHVSWDVSMGLSMTASDGSVTASDRLSGGVTFGAGSIAGFERSDIAISETSSQGSVSAKVTYNADLDLTYESEPFCLTGGTLTLKRVWTEVPPLASGIDPIDVSDAAVQFTWQGCDVVLASVGVRL